MAGDQKEVDNDADSDSAADKSFSMSMSMSMSMSESDADEKSMHECRTFETEDMLNNLQRLEEDKFPEQLSNIAELYGNTQYDNIVINFIILLFIHFSMNFDESIAKQYIYMSKSYGRQK